MPPERDCRAQVDENRVSAMPRGPKAPPNASSVSKIVKNTRSFPSIPAVTPGLSADRKHLSKKTCSDNVPLVQQQPIFGSVSVSSAKPVPTVTSQRQTAGPSQEKDIIDLTYDIDREGSLPQDCIKKLLGLTTINGKINTNLNFDDIWAIVLRLKDLFSSNNIRLFHPTWANTYRAEQANSSFNKKKYDKFVIFLSIDRELRTVLLVKSSKSAFYFDSISNGSIKQDLQRRIQFIIGVNKAALGEGWQHLHTNTYHKYLEGHSGLLALLSLESILRAFSLPDVSPTTQTLRYKYAEMILLAHPGSAGDLEPLLQEYLLLEGSSVRLEAFERDIDWAKSLRLPESGVMIKDEDGDEVEYLEESDDDDRYSRTTQLFVFHPIIPLNPVPLANNSLARYAPSKGTGGNSTVVGAKPTTWVIYRQDGIIVARPAEDRLEFHPVPVSVRKMVDSSTEPLPYGLDLIASVSRPSHGGGMPAGDIYAYTKVPEGLL